MELLKAIRVSGVRAIRVVWGGLIAIDILFVWRWSVAHWVRCGAYSWPSEFSQMLEGEGSIPVRDVGFPPLICNID